MKRDCYESQMTIVAKDSPEALSEASKTLISNHYKGHVWDYSKRKIEVSLTVEFLEKVL